MSVTGCTNITRYERLYYNRKGQGWGLMSSTWDMGQNCVNVTWVTAMTQRLSGFILFRIISSVPKSYQPSQAYIIQLIPMSNPHLHYIRVLWGCLYEQL